MFLGLGSLIFLKVLGLFENLFVGFSSALVLLPLKCFWGYFKRLAAACNTFIFSPLECR